jgi:hypothetical protein
MATQHVEDIDRRLRKLKAAITEFGECGDVEELFQIIHRPGWTTLPEAFLFSSLIDAAEQGLDSVRQLRGALLEGARAIGKGSVD